MSADSEPVCATPGVPLKPYSMGGWEQDWYRASDRIMLLCFAVTVAISVRTAVRHARRYSSPREQSLILQILPLAFIYSCTPTMYGAPSTCLFEFSAIAAFYTLAVRGLSLGGTRPVEAAESIPVLFRLPLSVNQSLHGFVCLRSLTLGRHTQWFGIEPTPEVLDKFVDGALCQYILIRLGVAVAGLVFMMEKLTWAIPYMQGAWFLTSGIVVYVIAVLYRTRRGLFLFKRATAKHAVFLALMLLPPAQGLAIALLEGRYIHGTGTAACPRLSAAQVGIAIDGLLIAIEMLFFAIALASAFSPLEYEVPSVAPSSIWRILLECRPLNKESWTLENAPLKK